MHISDGLLIPMSQAIYDFVSQLLLNMWKYHITAVSLEVPCLWLFTWKPNSSKEEIAITTFLLHWLTFEQILSYKVFWEIYSYGCSSLSLIRYFWELFSKLQWPFITCLVLVVVIITCYAYFFSTSLRFFIYIHILQQIEQNKPFFYIPTHNQHLYKIK